VKKRTFGVGQSDTRGLMRLEYWGVVGLELDTICSIRDRFIARRGADMMNVDILAALAVLPHVVPLGRNCTDYNDQKNDVDDAAVVDECVAAIQPHGRTFSSAAVSLSEVGYRIPVFQKLQFAFARARARRKANISRRVQHDDQTRVSGGRICFQNCHCVCG
jgi:hypothetical protein